MKYIYFVSYAWGSGFGNAEVALDKEIKILADIISVQRELKKRHNFANNPTVLNFQLLSIEENQNG